jgi:pimeloyl-ACP methyl ester carboxylesterase
MATRLVFALFGSFAMDCTCESVDLTLSTVPSSDPISSSLEIQESCGQQGVTCGKVSANGFEFDVAFSGHEGTAGDVLMLPGHPEHKEMFFPLMRELASKGYRSVAVDQRGYSPGARPLVKSAYNYNEIVKDIFAIADAVNFKRFHMVAHDQGARLSWHSMAVSAGQQRFISFSTLSIPHVDAFSDGLYGEHADLQQQIAVQYVTTFTLPNSASLHNDYWFKRVKPTGFNTSADYQRALWWYNGAIDSGNMASAPVMSVDFLQSQAVSSIDPSWLKSMIQVRTLFGEESAYPKQGVPQTVRVGNASMPVLYICGLSDHSDLCGRPFGKRSADYCPNGYSYLEVDCGHNVLACDKTTETQKVIKAIVNHVLHHSSPEIIVV